jgi:hypothetical protein
LGELWYDIIKTDGVKKDIDNNKPASGDGSIVDESSFRQFNEYPHDNIETKNYGDIPHRNLAFSVETQEFILNTLGVDLEQDAISTDLYSPLPGDVFNFALDTSDGGDGLLKNAVRFSSYNNDPAEGFLIDGQGRRLGYTEATGAVTEIPGSQWFGEVDGIGYIPDIVEGPFRLELTGLGEDYFVSVSLETEDGQAFLESEGFLAAGEELTLDVPLLPEVSLVPEPRTNAGGDAYVDIFGEQWLANDGFSGGRSYANANEIAQTDDDILYQSEYLGENFSYSQDVPNWSYDITLHFAEIYFNQPGRRVFDVSAEDELILDNFDVYSEAGGKNIAVEKTFTVEVNDGTLDLDFLAEVNNAKISAVEIKPAGTPIRVNGGEGNYTDSLGKKWSANDGLSGGRNSSRDLEIAQTDDDLLYQSEYLGQNFSYSF